MSTAPADGDGGLAAEWAGLLRVAVLGADRHPLAVPLPGWDAWCSEADPAVQLLDRAGAVTVARRAGALPSALAECVPIAPAPVDHRRPCPSACAARLRQLLGGEHEVLLAEWFAELERCSLQLPWELLPLLLLRGRRRPELDQTVRRLAGGRASWLAAVMPELGIDPTSRQVAGIGRFAPPPRPPDSRAAIAAVLGGLADGTATWAAVPRLLETVAAVDAVLLEPFVAALRVADCSPLCDRTRAELTWLAETRVEMLREFAGVDIGPADRADHHLHPDEEIHHD